jgi:type IV secretion system protein TrbI
MAPDASPNTLGKSAGVRRVNNVPLLLLGAVLITFLVMIGLVAADRAERQHAPPEPPKAKATGNTAMFAQSIAGDRSGGIVEPARPPLVPDLSDIAASAPVQIARPSNLDQPPKPPGRRPDADRPSLAPPNRQGGRSTVADDEESTRIRITKLQVLQEAAKAKTNVQFAAPRNSGSTSTAAGFAGTPQTREDVLSRLTALRQQIEGQRNSDPSSAYQARLAQIRNMTTATAGTTGTSGSAQLLTTSGGTSGRNSYAQFGQGGEGDRWKLDSQPEPPRSAYELRAGFVLPATLISGINSDLPGQIVAQVAQHVYDTATGEHILIPQGSRLVGTYSSDVAYGQARVLVAWQRIVFPDGKAMDIGAMPGADSAGYAGFTDQVNNHYTRLFASAFLLSGVTAGITYSQRESQATANGAPTASSALSEALGQQLGQVTAQILAKNLSISPTLEVRPGYRFNVVVTKDMTFPKAYQPFDY